MINWLCVIHVFKIDDHNDSLLVKTENSELVAYWFIEVDYANISRLQQYNMFMFRLIRYRE